MEQNARNVFISFRFEDGFEYKEDLSKLFDRENDTVDYSEDEDRSGCSEETIKKYLYDKLKRSSVTIILLTPKALNYNTDRDGKIDDWIYDEVRYSLEDREGNRTNGIIAVYVPECKDKLLGTSTHKCQLCDGYKTTIIYNQDNLFRLNMMNVKPEYKKNKCSGIFDTNWDSYCSLVSYEDFKGDPSKYIEIAFKKKEMRNHYTLIKRIGD
ncbi:MAG: TIR domain-containing protein [Bacilli bacterium]|nr:TIR domain-containing protein [Bacilli bacterium]